MPLNTYIQYSDDVHVVPPHTETVPEPPAPLAEGPEPHPGTSRESRHNTRVS
ncbi:hypothetical protein DPMN_040206 [Dreissena polymorpha]|uniref:Uncharacterized protein n=1 Tax=Dreissena polymorpha TaxID=45954 RepID=A0A9D4CUU9_DREPO|nr:hypothetical protein DPMN_040206 [Dreissena polymorpha]